MLEPIHSEAEAGHLPPKSESVTIWAPLTIAGDTNLTDWMKTLHAVVSQRLNLRFLPSVTISSGLRRLFALSFSLFRTTAENRFTSEASKIKDILSCNRLLDALLWADSKKCRKRHAT